MLVGSVKAADEVSNMHQYAMHAFAEALEAIPLVLAENSGPPTETLAEVKSRQVTENNSRLGVDCLYKGTNDMEKLVYVPLISKRQQILLATQLAHSQGGRHHPESSRVRRRRDVMTLRDFDEQ